MTHYIAILRGINVAGSKKLKMAELKASLEKAGYSNISTYIQSGNVKFASAPMNVEKLSETISALIEKDFGYQIPVIIITTHDLDEVIKNNPFLKEEKADISSLHVTFLGSVPHTDKLPGIENINSGRDELQIAEKWIYLYCPDGYGRTKLTNTFFENKLKVKATTRNWKTVLKLREMLLE